MTQTKLRHSNGFNYQPLFGTGAFSSPKYMAGGRKIVLLFLAKDITTHKILLHINCLVRMSDDGGMR